LITAQPRLKKSLVFMSKNKISIFWFRRDLRLDDNMGLNMALESGLPVLAIFIFDDEILDSLPKNDARVSFIYSALKEIDKRLKEKNSSLLIKKGNITKVWISLIAEFDVKKVFLIRDYNPYAIQRDLEIKDFLESNSIEVLDVKHQVIFEKNDILKADGKPYTVYTPYKNKWLAKLKVEGINGLATKK